MLRAYRKQRNLSQKELAAKTELIDGTGISCAVLSQIEHKQRFLSLKYLRLLDAAGVFSGDQLRKLYHQAIADMVLQRFGLVVISIALSRDDEATDETQTK